MRRSRPRLVGAALSALFPLLDGRAAAASPEEHLAYVLEPLASFDHRAQAQAIGNLLRLRVSDGGEFALASGSPSLVALAGAVKCDLRGFDAANLTENADREFDEGCQRSIGARLGAGGLFWGHVYGKPDGRLWVKLHLWRAGAGGQSKALPYDEASRDRLVGRLYEHLTHPERAADVRVNGPVGLAGELWVDTKAEGPFAEGAELTVPAGEHSFELRHEGRVLARAKATVMVGKANEVRLAFVPRTNLDPTEGFRDPPPVVPSGDGWKRTAGWVGLGVGAAGLIGAATFFGLHRGAESDLDDLCREQAGCPREAQTALDRSNRWGTLSLISLGVGAVSAGVGTFLLVTAPRSRSSRAATPGVRFGVVPMAGGAFTTLTWGAF
jgi:hypothetical protein